MKWSLLLHFVLLKIHVMQEEEQKMGKEVSESCLDILLIETVSSYTNGFYAGKPELVAQAVEAIGYQVGNQLCER